MMFGPALPTFHQEANQPTIAFCAIAPIPEMGAKDWALLQILAKTLSRRTDEYVRPEILSLTDGRTVQCQIMQDCLIIQFEVKRNEMLPGVSLLASILTKSSLLQTDIDQAIQDLTLKSKNYWDIGLDPSMPPPSSVTRDQLQEFYKRFINPNTIRVCVGGSVDEELVKQAWVSRTLDWKVGEWPQYGDITPMPMAKNEVGPSSFVELKSPTYSANSPGLELRILALVALGSGRNGSLSRVCREQYSWSYRQESVLWPLRDGFQSRLAFMSTQFDGSAEHVSEFRKGLLADIDSWNATSLARAQVLAEQSVNFQNPFSPLYLSPRGLVDDSLSGRTYIDAYWQMKTGVAWNSTDLIRKMKQISLESLKQAAKELVESSSSSVLVKKN